MYAMLEATVYKFAERISGLTDQDLATEWSWGSYASEGIRFALFRIYEELESLGAQTTGMRAAAGPALTEAQVILGQYQLAYRELQAVLLGVSDELAAQAPAEGEWSVQQTYSHILQADIGFFAVIQHGLDKIRAGQATLQGPDEADYDRLLPDMPEDARRALGDQTLGAQIRLHKIWQPRILKAFLNVSAEELDRHTVFWEEETYPNRFRIGRYAAHMRQHTVQIEKALADLGTGPSEAQRLIRLICGALARAEAAVFGAEGQKKSRRG